VHVNAQPYLCKWPDSWDCLMDTWFQKVFFSV
jgi:hypothetical protein